MIGQILGSRYEIIEEIGRGGMAYVYKARCTYLDRVVAVKVLQPQFANDDEFVRRFRREAQAAASLSHPNIVNIYDVGRDDDLHYIVMEYVPGKTLKDWIKDNVSLSIEDSVRIAVQVGMALEHAHQNEIVHCDIKPHNILMTLDGRAKVADFGLARAVSSTTITYTESVIGSVHYFSPEQASGERAGKKSDIYALGIVLYEMTTGKLPFEGESPVTIALQHIREEVKSPRLYNTKIPESLERVILKSIEKDPAKRHDTSGDFVKDLREFSADYVPEETLDHHSEYSTQVMPAVDDKKSEEGSKWGKIAKALKKNPRKTAMMSILVILLILALAAAGLKVRDYFEVLVVEAPDVIGMSLAEAIEELDSQGLEYRVVGEVHSDQFSVGHVVSQEPAAGQEMKTTFPVSLMISKGREMVSIPRVIGMKQADAEVMILNEGLKMGEISGIYHAEIPADYVIDQNPRADIGEIERDSTIDLIVSSGPQPVEVRVPDLIGRYLSNAREAIQNANLELGRVIEDSDSPYPHNMVVRQSPAIGSSIEEGMKVDLTVSKRPDEIVSEPTNTSKVRIDVPSSGPDTQEVRLDLMDINRYRTVDTSLRNRGESFEVEVTWIGEKALIKIYVNGVFHDMQEIN